MSSGVATFTANYLHNWRLKTEELLRDPTKLGEWATPWQMEFSVGKAG